MTVYIQRQFGGFIAPGTNTDPTTYPASARVWDLKDVYPSSILSLAQGKQISYETTIAASDTLNVSLPFSYVQGNNLFVLIRSNKLVKVQTSLYNGDTSKALIRPGLASDQNGVLCFTDKVQSITITNTTAVTATIQYVAYEIPSLTASDNWRSTYQTTGVVQAN